MHSLKEPVLYDENCRRWICREQLESALAETHFFAEEPDREHMDQLERFSALLDELEMETGEIAFEAEWEKLSPSDPEMDDTERTLFADETYRCSRCGTKSYFGVACTRDRYCQSCGARMINSGRRG
ncbi:MAG: hypothetical protein IJ242_11055 [Clostridia bacterium]|nr:hypothetical protein [Clostridia bacterium]